MKLEKLSLNALKERAEFAPNELLLNSITGGLMAECHEGSCDPPAWTVDFTCNPNPCTPSGTSPYSSWSEFYNALGQFFIKTGL